MFNFYLYNKSYEKANTALIENNMRDLNDLVIADSKPEDYFLKNDSIWDIETADGNFADVVFSKIQDRQLSQAVIPKLFQSIPSIPEEFSTLEEFDNSPYKIYNAFYGALFSDPISERYITDKAAYSAFKKKNLWKLTPKTLWERKEMLFSKVILCPSVKNGLDSIGASYLPQIIKKLTELDRYAAENWKKGEFNYRDANRRSSLDITPESSVTLKQEKLYNARLFTLPDGRRECFDMHIKTGDLRFHFYPENGKIYVGYIEKHLPTDKYK